MVIGSKGCASIPSSSKATPAVAATNAASDFAAKLRSAQLEGKDDVPQQQLVETKKTREIAEKQLEEIKKKTAAVLG